MTKQYALQVQMGEKSKLLFDEKRLVKMLEAYAEILFRGATAGTVPAVKVFECVDSQDKNLADFAKEIA